MTSKPEILTKDEFVPPIVKAEDINNQQTKETALTLITSGQKQPNRAIQTYTLPESPEPEDPRSIARIVYDKFLCTILPKTKTAQIYRRIKDQKIIADAESQYGWIMSSSKVINNAITTLHDSYKNIADYVNTIRDGIQKAGSRLENGNQRIEQSLEEITKLEDDKTSGELTSEIEKLLGKEAAEKAHDCLRKETSELNKNVAQIKRENEYIAQLIEYHSKLLPASESSLKDIDEAIKTAQGQQLDLQLTLSTYEGLTKNQIDATRAMQFLQDVQTIHGNLKSKMKEVDDLTFEQKERLKLSAPTYSELPVAHEDILQLREARREK